MPTYEHYCRECDTITEDFCAIADRKQFIPCKECGSSAERIMSLGSIRGDDMPAWMRHPETLGCLQNSAEKPIQTRSDYNRVLKARGIVEQSKYREI